MMSQKAELSFLEPADYKVRLKIRKKYTSVGVVTALPSAIPGFGTAAQIAIEAGAISGDLALMLRWMASNCYGIALIFDKDISSDLDNEFIKILGLWCGAIQVAKQGTVKVAQKVAVVSFNKNVSAKILQKINRVVGTRIFTKYGTKRGTIALGRLIPFGVGAAVGGTFNFYTMNRFKKTAIQYYKNENQQYYFFDK